MNYLITHDMNYSYYIKLFSTFNILTKPYKTLQMEFVDLTRQHSKLTSREITLKMFIDYVINNFNLNNQVSSHLESFANESSQIDHLLDAQGYSPRYSIHGNDGREYQYYIRKNPLLLNYCLYVSIPSDHPLINSSYEDIPGATFCSSDNLDPQRTVFGWDYLSMDICNSTMIYMLLFSDEINSILGTEIIKINKLKEDAWKHVEWFAQYL